MFNFIDTGRLLLVIDQLSIFVYNIQDNALNFTKPSL